MELNVCWGYLRWKVVQIQVIWRVVNISMNKQHFENVHISMNKQPMILGEVTGKIDIFSINRKI